MKGKVVFVGHFEPGSDEVKVPAIPALQSSEGTVHGVLLLTTAYNQLDQHSRWLPVPDYLALVFVVLLAFAPAWLFRRRRWHIPLAVSFSLVAAASVAGLFLPLAYPWGTALVWGVLAIPMSRLLLSRAHR